MMKVFEGIPAPPPRHAKSFRSFGRGFLFTAAALVPLFFLSTFQPVAEGIAALLALAAFICFLGTVLEERRLIYPRSLLALAMLLFIAMEAVSVWFSTVPSESVFGELTAPDSLVSAIVCGLLFFLFFFFFRRNDVRKIGAAIGTGLLIAAMVALVDLLHTASLGAEGAATQWGILIAAFVAALAVIRPSELSGWRKVGYFAALAASLVVLALINNQAIWLGLALAVMAVAALRFEPREHFHYAFAIITLALFFALVSSRLPIPKPTSNDFRPTISASVATVTGSLKGSELLTGTGPATFAYDFDLQKPASVDATPYWAEEFSQGHDFAVTLIATSGVVSFLLFLCLVFLALQPFIHISALGTEDAISAAAAAFLLVALFWYPASFAELVLLFILLGVLHVDNLERSVSLDPSSSWGSLSLSAVGMVLAAAALAGAFVIGEQYAASVFFSQSNALAASGDLSDAFAKIKNAIGLDPSDSYYRAAADILVSEAKVLSSSSDPSAAVQLGPAVESAIQAAEEAVTKNPRNTANWQNLGSVYEAIMPLAVGADVSAVNSYAKAQTLDPNDPRWDVDIARVYIESAGFLANSSSTVAARQSDWSNAEATLEKAIALKDDYSDPRVMLVELYLQEGNITQAIQRVQELETQNPLDAGVAFELGYLYYEQGQSGQAAQEFQVAAILDPNYANAHYFLGLIEDQKGMTTQALAEFEKVEAVSPDNEAVADIIANLQAGRPAFPGSGDGGDDANPAGVPAATSSAVQTVPDASGKTPSTVQKGR
jgi:tetratricopeptide (TPR) repeat protein